MKQRSEVNLKQRPPVPYKIGRRQHDGNFSKAFELWYRLPLRVKPHQRKRLELLERVMDMSSPGNKRSSCKVVQGEQKGLDLA